MEFTKGFLGMMGEAPSTPEETVSQESQSLSIGIGGGLQELFSPDTEGEGTPPKQPVDHKKEADRLMNTLILTESNGVHREKDGTLRVSDKGAQGITQLMPRTAGDPGYGIRPLKNQTPQEYIRFGREYLAAMIREFGNVEKGVAAYNAGPGTVQKAVAKASKEGKDWKDFLPKETKEYIKKVR